MATFREINQQHIDKIINDFGLFNIDTFPVQEGSANSVFKIVNGSGEVYFLKVYEGEGDSVEALSFQQAIMLHLKNSGVPSAPYIRTVYGTINSTIDDLLCTLQPALNGLTLRRSKITKEILDRVFSALNLVQSTPHNLKEHNTRHPKSRFFNHLAPNKAKFYDAELKNGVKSGWIDPEVERFVVEELEYFMNSFGVEDYLVLPKAPIHGDPGPDNFLFQGKTLTGIIDFDCARVDARIYDAVYQAVYFRPTLIPPNEAYDIFFGLSQKTQNLTDEECLAFPKISRFLQITLLQDIISRVVENISSYDAAEKEFETRLSYAKKIRDHIS